MTRSIVGGLLLSATLAVSGGCNVCRAILYDPFGPSTLCDGRRCGRAWGEPCGPLRGRWAAPAMIDQPGDGECCDAWGAASCGYRTGLVRGPLSFVFALFTAGSYPGCYGGCGERYWGDWYSDPPDWCDPCDQQGNFNGGGGSWSGGPGPAVMSGGEVDGAAGTVGASPGGCRSCGQGKSSYWHNAPRGPGYPSPGRQNYAATNPSSVQRPASPSHNPAPRPPAWQASRGPLPTGQSQYSASPSTGPYAPRLISTTDRVVKPAMPEQGPHLAQPPGPGVVRE